MEIEPSECKTINLQALRHRWLEKTRFSTEWTWWGGARCDQERAKLQVVHQTKALQNKRRLTVIGLPSNGSFGRIHRPETGRGGPSRRASIQGPRLVGM